MRDGWVSCSLGEVCDLLKRGIAPKYVDEGGLLVINQKCVRNHRVDLTLARRHDLAKKAVPDERLLQTGDALVNSTGVGTLGRVAQIRVELPEPATVDTHVTILRPSAGLFRTDFFGYLLIFIENEITALGAGASGQTELSRTSLSDSVSVYYPKDHAEQDRIVTVLDETFEAIATATANTERTFANAQELLEAHRDRVINAAEADGEQTTLDQASRSFEYGSSAKSLPQGSVPVLRMGNLQRGEVDWTSLVYSSDPGEIERYSLRPKDVLFNRTNSAAHVGKAAIFRGGREALFAGYLIRVNYDPALLDPEYLNEYLNCRRTREYGKSVMAQSVNQANISAGKLKDYPIVVPRLHVQREAVSKLRDLQQQATLVESASAQKLAHLDALKQSILQKTFSGELTAVDRELSDVGV